MADVNNYRRGETKPVVAKIVTAQAVSRGDLCGLSTGNVYRAEDHSYSSLSQAQFDFVANFVGVSSQRKEAGEAKAGTGGGADNRVRVATAGTFEFDCHATTFEVGDLVGPADNSTNDGLESQKVEAVTDATRAVGRVEDVKSVEAALKVKVRIFGREMQLPEN